MKRYAMPVCGMLLGFGLSTFVSAWLLTFATRLGPSAVILLLPIGLLPPSGLCFGLIFGCVLNNKLLGFEDKEST